MKGRGHSGSFAENIKDNPHTCETCGAFLPLVCTCMRGIVSVCVFSTSLFSVADMFYRCFVLGVCVVKGCSLGNVMAVGMKYVECVAELFSGNGL